MESKAFTDNQVSQNPLKLIHSDVFELIFQHFHFDDVVKFSEVSPEFFNISAGSSKCMSKINIPSELLVSIKQQNMNSKRFYQSISLTDHCQTPAKKLIEVVKSVSNNWKCVKILEKKFEGSEFQELMLFIEPTVEELKISDCEINQISNENFRFPKLKKLTIRNCESPALFIFSNSKLNVNCLNLKVSNKLQVPKKIAVHDLVKKTILNCDKLEILTLSSWKLSMIFTENILKLMECRLKCLEVSVNDRISDSEALNKLLTCPKISDLTSLTVKGKTRNLLLENIFKLPKLEKLKLSRLNLGLPLNLKLNPFIKELHLLDKTLPVPLQKKILENTPNLKFLSIYAISSQNIDFIASNCKLIEGMSLAYMWLTNPPAADCLLKLQKLQVAGDVQFLLEQEILSKPESERTNFENLILKAI